jgi:hypothetical protein
MSMRWRRIIDFSAVVFAIVLAVRLKFELQSSWWAAIGMGVVVVTPFVISRFWATYSLRRVEYATNGMKRRQRLNFDQRARD